MDKRKNNGGARDNAGRKPKVEEQKLIEKLSPLEPKAFQALDMAIMEGESWAVKMYFEYMYGKPKERIEQINYDAGKITKEEAKLINEVLENKY